MAEFQFIVDGELVTYDDYDKIPDDFEKVIKFLPDGVPEEHTQEDHEEWEKMNWNGKLQVLLEKERARNL